MSQPAPANNGLNPRGPRRILRRSRAAAAAVNANANDNAVAVPADAAGAAPAASLRAQVDGGSRRRSASSSSAPHGPLAEENGGSSVVARDRAMSLQRSVTFRGTRDGSESAGSPPASTTSRTVPSVMETSVTSAAAVGFARPKVIIDRAAFSSINFSSPLLVNNISNRILFPIIMKYRADLKRAAASSSMSGGGGTGTAADAKLKASDGSALFSGANMAPGARKRYDTAESAQPIDHHAVAGELSAALEGSWAEVARLLAEEEATLQRQEVRCKRVEIKEKRQLAKIRLGLEATTTRLQEYEDRVSNAQAATAGIEQHLSQSNARVQRGKSVSQLLSFFKMFTSTSQSDLAGVLKALSKARIAQRTAVTNRWKRGRVSPFNPRYFSTVVNATEEESTRRDESTAAAAPTAQTATLNDPVQQQQQQQQQQQTGGGITPRRKGKSVYRRGARRAGGAVVNAAASSNDVSGGASRTPSAGAQSNRNSDNGDAKGGNRADAEDDLSSEDSVDEAGDNIMNVKLHRAEAAAVAAGLDRMFVVRSYTEAQVEWCQKLMLLANELGDLASNTKNIEVYIAWLRQELVVDLFHVIACFNDFYDGNSQSAVHMSYGRALLKTTELVSRLYTTLTPSNDALLKVFFSRAVNDLGVALFSEYSPRPLPGQPPLPNPTPLLAMDHFRKYTDGELRKAFDFLIQQVRRDVTVVETIFGMTNTARQQLLSQVTEGVVKRFIEQQIKLAETFKNSILASEGSLSPRSKRKCGVRVADAIAYYNTVEVRLFTFFLSFIKELRKSFDAGEVEFLNRFTDAIFVHRSEYSTSRTELQLFDRYCTLIEENYTRSLHPIPEECFDLREAHMQKTKDMLDRLTEVATRVKAYALPKEVGPYVFDLVQAALTKIGIYLDAELRKTLESIRSDRDNWRQRPKSEEELLKPPRPESQQCGLRMLLFAQSSLMSLNDNIAVICMPLLQNCPRLVQDVDEARTTAMENLDDRAERLLNMCAQAIIVRSLSILLHYQLKTDYLPKENKNKEMDTIAPPCTRACTLFCYYITRQLEESKEFIRLSNGQVPQRQTASQIATGANLSTVASTSGAVGTGTNPLGGDANAGTVPSYYGGPDASPSALPAAAVAISTVGISAVRARARTMNLQQLLYGDGGPSSFVRTVGVCLYQGISAHLKAFTVNDRGALVYKQDVTAYKEAMTPLTATPGLGGAVVETLFQMLKETSSLLIMPLDHIKEVKESGTLRLMTNEDKLKFIRIRQDVRGGLRVMKS